MATLPSALQDNICLYQEALERADTGHHYNPGPCIVAKNICDTNFAAWTDTIPAACKVAYKKEAGEILLYGDPLPPHARTAGWFLMEIAEQIEDSLGKAVKRSFAYSVGEQAMISSFGFKEPDFAVIQEHYRAGQATVVGEIGYHCEKDFETVKDEVELWCRNMHPVVIGVKITDNTALSTVQDPRMEVIVKVVGREDQEFHVGQGASHVCAQGSDVIQIPSELFLPRTLRIQRMFRHPIKLDLFELLQGVKRWVMQSETL